MRKPGQNASRQKLDLSIWGFVLILALAPLPFGSVYSQAWVVWALTCGVMGLLTFWSAERADLAVPSPPEVRIAGILWLVVLVYLVAQASPLVLASGSGSAPAADAGLSISPLFSSMMLLRQSTYFLLAAAIYWLARSEPARRLLLVTMLISGVGYALYGLVSLQTGDTILSLDKWAYFGSATGPFVNRNSFATYLSLTAMISLGLAASTVVPRMKASASGGPSGSIASVLILLSAYFLLMVTIVATQSRMGLFACLCGSTLIVIAAALRAGRFQTALLLSPIGIAAVGGALYLIGGGLLTRIEAQGFALNDRLELYRQVLAMIELRPWTGWGGGTFEIAFRAVQSEPLSSTVLWDRAHNSYLSLWSELGVVFGSLLILVVGVITILLLRRLPGSDRSLSPLLIGLGGITVAAVHSLVDFSLEIPAIAMQFTAILSIAAAAATRWRSSDRSDSQRRSS